MLKIIGTDRGRIFMCGKDGSVYELYYQAEDGCFSKKCRKLKHSSTALRSILPSFLFGSSDDAILDIVYDASRHYLYTLSRKSTIQTYDLGVNGDKMTLIGQHNQVLAKAVRLLRGNRTADWNKKDFRVVSIFPIPRTVSQRAMLVAVSNHGHRLYFGIKYSRFTLLFVRICPPSITKPANSRMKHFDPQYFDNQSPRHVRVAYYNSGIFLMADVRPGGGDTLVGIVPDSYTTPSTSRWSTVHKLNESVESTELKSRYGCARFISYNDVQRTCIHTYT